MTFNEITRFMETKATELFDIKFNTEIKIVSNQQILDHLNSTLKEGRYTETSLFFAHVVAYRLRGKDYIEGILINELTLEHLSQDEIEKILLHELTHYALIKKGSLEFRDGDPEFERTVVKIGAFSNSSDFTFDCYDKVVSKMNLPHDEKIARLQLRYQNR